MAANTPKKILAFLSAVFSPVEKILKMAAKEKSQLKLIVMATRVHGIVGGVLIGSMVQHVA